METGRKWWLRETTGILFKLYPLVFMAMGWLNTAETFLVLVVSYQVMAYMSLTRSTFIIGYEFVKVRFPKVAPYDKVEVFVLYWLSWFISMMLMYGLFSFAFGMLSAPVYREEASRALNYGHMMDDDTFNRYFYLGRHSALLERTLWINTCWFFIVEAVQLGRMIRNYSPDIHRYTQSLYWGIHPFASRKQKNRKISWIVLFTLFFGWMVTIGKDGYAVASFFVFDIGFLLLSSRSEMPDAEPVGSIPIHNIIVAAPVVEPAPVKKRRKKKRK